MRLLAVVARQRVTRGNHHPSSKKKELVAMQTAEELLRTLARVDPGDALVLSIYLDLRPHTTGENPAVRPAQINLKDRLRAIEKTLLPRGQALDEFRADAARVNHHFDEHAEPYLQGVAIFACDRLQLFETLETGVPFDDQVVLEPLPDLFQLVHLAATSGASVETVKGHSALNEAGGVGALLRYNVTWV